MTANEIKKNGIYLTQIEFAIGQARFVDICIDEFTYEAFKRGSKN